MRTIITSVRQPTIIWVPEKKIEDKPFSNIKKVNKHNKNFIRGR
jgi:hypothetical protein